MSNTKTRTATLPDPIKIGDKKVREIVLREPMAGEMRGLKLADVLQLDVSAMITLIPRISSPPLTGAQVAGMAPRNFTAVTTQVMPFFATTEQMAQMGLT